MSKPDTTCPACDGRGAMAAFVETESRGYFDPSLKCSLCLGEGKISGTKADWVARGKMHYKARIDRDESVRECAMRLGVSPSTLSGMEHGRIDPTPLEAINDAAQATP